MKSFKRNLKIALAVTAALGLINSAHASLIAANPTDVNGAGLGAVNTVLTITSPNSTSTETGAVSWNGTTAVTSGDTQAQTSSPTIGSLGITSAAQLRITFNAAEPSADSINLTNFVLTIFSPTGTALFNSGAFTPITFASTNPGVGNAGFVFRLDDAQAAAAQTAAFGAGFANNRIGLSASATDATGGLETFFVSQSVGAVPEPEAYGMLLSGLGLLAFIARRRRSKG
ncbi:MAG: hypothetical protein JWN94_1019 [Betaproteobacteria bacterium]|nr:hypothetical protein [Betaproteobacteria bacterium]